MTVRFSHPADGCHEAVHLTDHLEDVADRAREVVPEDASTITGKPMADFVSRLAYVHDFGKATTWFQQHIDVIEGEPVGVPTHHSPIGAVLAYYVLQQVGYDKEECLAGYVAVARHHGSLPDVPEFVFRRTAWNRKRSAANEQQEEIIEQIENIDSEAYSFAESAITEATDDHGSWAEFASAVRDHTEFDSIKRQVSSTGFTHDSSRLSSDFYACVLQAWSALVLADKTSVAHAPREGYSSTRPDRTVLKSFIDGLPPNESTLSAREQQLNDWRADARANVLENVVDMAETDPGVATITLPTGMGKTLTGLDAALTLRDLTDRDRVVYALPFTSIIDQVDSELRTIFKSDARDDLLTVHHHLSEAVVELKQGKENTDVYARVEEMLGESWRSGLVLTTYVQLFESLVCPRNTQSMKLPALYDSVIVLDEPQGLPHDWWPLVRRILRELNTKYNATVIAMTATQPQLFQGEAHELVDEPEQYFQEIERVVYEVDDSLSGFGEDESEPVDYDHAAERIASTATDGQHVLSVCNTIDSSRALTRAITERLSPVEVGPILDQQLTDHGLAEIDGEDIASAVERHSSDVALIHLSTRIRPVDRELLLEAIEELGTRDIPRVVISTQLIEAGVDVSFDRVFRDFAPIDSLVQAAGRCNRSFERDRGTVTLWWLDSPPETAMTPAEAVYETWGESLLSLSARVLETFNVHENSSIREPTVAWDCVREYYRRLVEDRRVGKQSFVDLLDTGAFGEAGQLSLIEQRRAIDVIVCRTDHERARIDRIKDAWHRRDFDRVNGLLDESKPTQVSIPIYDDNSPEADKIGRLDSVHEETDLRWLDTRQHRGYFNATHGLVVPDTTVEGRFL